MTETKKNVLKPAVLSKNLKADSTLKTNSYSLKIKIKMKHLKVNKPCLHIIKNQLADS